MFRKRIDYDFIFYFYNLQLTYWYLISFNNYQPLQIVQFFGKALTPIKIQLNFHFPFFKSKYIPYIQSKYNRLSNVLPNPMLRWQRMTQSEQKKKTN